MTLRTLDAIAGAVALVGVVLLLVTDAWVWAFDKATWHRILDVAWGTWCCAVVAYAIGWTGQAIVRWMRGRRQR